MNNNRLRDDSSLTVSSTASSPSFDVDESIDMEDELNIPVASTFLKQKKQQPTYRSRLFDDGKTEMENLSLTPTAPKRKNSHGRQYRTVNPHCHALPLEPLDLNNCLDDKKEKSETNTRRKRSSEESGYRRTPGRNRNCNECSEKNFYTSPSSSSYMTMDGRCVTSKNPFSPMLVDNLTPPRSTTKFEGKSPKAPAPYLPVSLDAIASRSVKKERQCKNQTAAATAMSNAAPPPTSIRHRLQKRNDNDHHEKNFFTQDGFPDQSGRYSFTGSPIQESSRDSLDMMDTTDSSSGTGSYNFKIRRLHVQDDVVAAASAAVQSGSCINYYGKSSNLHVDTSAPYSHSMEEVSPTDVLSFPTPPTPSKTQKSRSTMPSLRTSAPPETPFLERRRRNKPTSLLPSSAFFSRSTTTDSEQDTENEESNEIKSRFHSDFDVIGQLGKGSFGKVYKVLSRLDGCMYAVKTALRQAKGKSDRDRMLKEVYALAALSDQADTATFHIVRYHQAWMEDNRLYIQTELCTSTLADEVSSSEKPLTTIRRYKLMREILLALEFIHRNEMVHLDIKPDNIFIKNDQFKLGDFGLVTKISYHDDVEEGDSRYMSMELLSGDHQDLTKSDIFSLGATLYEISLGKPLPTNGQEWQDIRQCKFQKLPDTPQEMETIIRQMMHPKVSSRLAASEFLKHPQLLSEEQKALVAEKNKVLQANKQLAAQAQRFHTSSLMPRAKIPRSGLIRANTWTGTTGSLL